MTRKPLLWSLMLVVLLCSSGATCNRFRRPADPLTPVAFVAPPSLEEIVYAVNANTSRVQSLQTDSASISAQGYPSLRANIAMERPQRFRLRASFLGPELDVGGNDELVWFWAKSSPDPAIYYARYDQYRGSLQRVLPIEPAWLIEAFGLVQLEPGGQHQGPVPKGNGYVEITSRAGQAGEYVRTLTVDDKYGWIVQQQLSDASGQIVAIAKCGNHRFYAAAGVSLPHHLEINVPRAQLSFTVDVGQYAINQLTGDPTQLWSLPQMEGYNLVNLSETVPFTGGGIPPTAVPTQAPPQVQPDVSYRPRYRGYSAVR